MNALTMRYDGIETWTLRVEVEGLHPALAELVRTLKRVHNGKKTISAYVEIGSPSLLCIATPVS
jgi:hypothetical protein